MALAANGHVVSTGSSGMLPRIQPNLLEANNMSFEAGELVWSNAGAITVISGTPFTAAEILGFAQKAGTNVTSGNIAIPVVVIHPTDLVKMPTTASGTALTTTTNFTVGNGYGIYVASNVHYVDYDEGTEVCVIFEEHCKTPSGAFTGWGLFRFIPAVCQGWLGDA